MLATKVIGLGSSAADAHDQRVVLHGVSWRDYETLLAIRGDDRPAVRLYFLEGSIELISPSEVHEWVKKTLARLLEAYADEIALEFNGYGSLTVRRAGKEHGAEPDECYVVGRHKGRPDLAIEVEWTSGGLDKLAIYSGLGVRELWICRVSKGRPHIEVLVLQRGRYVAANGSRLLPDLDVAMLARHLAGGSQSQAVRSFRAALRRRPRA